MTTYHSAWEFVAGDDWEIVATLIDESDLPYDLSGNPDLKWVMLDNTYHRVTEAADYSISITDAPAGKCTIHIPATTTTRFAGGYYTDALRITIGGIVSTLFYGPIYVMGDPWGTLAAGSVAYGDVRFFRPQAKRAVVAPVVKIAP